MLLWHKSPAPRSSSSSTQEYGNMGVQYVTRAGPEEFSMETNGEDFSAYDDDWSYKEHG